MRAVPLATTTIRFPGRTEDAPIAYATVMIELMGGPAPRGITLAQQRIDLAIIDALEAAQRAKAKEVLLEEPQWARLTERLNTNEFPFPSRAFVEIGDAVANAAQKDVNATRTPEQGAADHAGQRSAAKKRTK